MKYYFYPVVVVLFAAIMYACATAPVTPEATNSGICSLSNGIVLNIAPHSKLEASRYGQTLVTVEDGTKFIVPDANGIFVKDSE